MECLSFASTLHSPPFCVREAQTTSTGESRFAG
jgi:hypothetical protein